MDFFYWESTQSWWYKLGISLRLQKTDRIPQAKPYYHTHQYCVSAFATGQSFKRPFVPIHWGLSCFLNWLSITTLIVHRAQNECQKVLRRLSIEFFTLCAKLSTRVVVIHPKLLAITSRDILKFVGFRSKLSSRLHFTGNQFILELAAILGGIQLSICPLDYRLIYWMPC